MAKTQKKLTPNKESWKKQSDPSPTDETTRHRTKATHGLVERNRAEKNRDESWTWHHTIETMWTVSTVANTQKNTEEEGEERRRRRREA